MDLLELNFEIVQDTIKDYSTSYTPKLIQNGCSFKFPLETNKRITQNFPKEIVSRIGNDDYFQAIYCKVSKKITSKKEILYYIVYQLRYKDSSAPSYAISYEIDQMLYSHLKLLLI